MRPSITSVALLALAGAACAERLPTSPATTTSSSTVGLQRSEALRPLEGACTTTFSAPPFPLPPILHQIDTGTCNLTHLGLSDLYGELDINFAAGTQSGWRTLTAANGDELHITVAGTNAAVVGGLVRINAQLTIVGGTGRFDGATGSAQATGVATLATRSTSIAIDGWVKY